MSSSSNTNNSTKSNNKAAAAKKAEAKNKPVAPRVGEELPPVTGKRVRKQRVLD